MKRNQFWLWLLLLPPLLQSCEKKYPQVETIINATIVDENDKPLEGINVYFSGSKSRGLSATATFSVKTKSDKNGEFTFSQIIPNGTIGAYLDLGGVKPPLRQYILKNNIYVEYISTTIFANITIGKTNNINFKIAKP